MTSAPHIPVMKEQVLAYLDPRPGQRIIDGTFGFGGHSQAMLAAGAEVLGLDLDDAAHAACRRLAAAQTGLTCQRTSFRHLDQALQQAGWERADGVLLDLGVSSYQLDDAEKGFSYRTDAPLDLRFDQSRGEPAARLLAESTEAELADLIWRFGEERGSRRIARAIVRRRDEEPVTTTGRLRAVVQKTVPRGAKPEPVLSRVFQALRIAVNDELAALEETLTKLPVVLAPAGRFVVIAYHSLEDRLVKRFIDRERRDCLCPPELPVCTCGHRASLRRLTRKPAKAAALEISNNSRARSARLRAAQMI